MISGLFQGHPVCGSHLCATIRNPPAPVKQKGLQSPPVSMGTAPIFAEGEPYRIPSYGCLVFSVWSGENVSIPIPIPTPTDFKFRVRVPSQVWWCSVCFIFSLLVARYSLLIFMRYSLLLFHPPSAPWTLGPSAPSLPRYSLLVTSSHTTPWSIIESTTLRKPAMLAPAT
jgi:hypothetical protein